MTKENPVKAAWGSIPPLGRDLLVAVMVIVVLLGSLWAYTGQPVGSAPLVVVESGSMMHPDAGYGKLGTIDPGDLILVRAVDADEAPQRIVTKYGAMATQDQGRPGEGTREGYGHPGDVIIFSQDECSGPGRPPIIHRAMTWVEVHGDGTFSYHDENGQWQERRSSVELPGLNRNNDAFVTSGWVTKGDNPTTNRQADQVGICSGMLIEPDWLVGKARGEIPWLGLLKFMVSGNNVQNPPHDWCTVWNARAPCDLFTMLWITIGVIIAIPLAWDLSARFFRRGGDGGASDGAGGIDDDPPMIVHKGPKMGPGEGEGSGSEPGRPWSEMDRSAGEDEEDGDSDGIKRYGP